MHAVTHPSHTQPPTPTPTLALTQPHAVSHLPCTLSPPLHTLSHLPCTLSHLPCTPSHLPCTLSHTRTINITASHPAPPPPPSPEDGARAAARAATAALFGREPLTTSTQPRAGLNSGGFLTQNQTFPSKYKPVYNFSSCRFLPANHRSYFQGCFTSEPVSDREAGQGRTRGVREGRKEKVISQSLCVTNVNFGSGDADPVSQPTPVPPRAP